MSMTLEIVAQRVEVLEKQMAELLADNKKSEKKAKKQKKSNDSHDNEPKKKKGPSGYLLYSNVIRKDVTEKLAEESDEKPKGPVIMKKLGAMWKALSDDERDAWNEKAKELKDDA